MQIYDINFISIIEKAYYKVVVSLKKIGKPYRYFY